MGKPYINRADGTFYQLSATSAGQLQASFVGVGQCTPLLMQERSSPATTYELKITLGGQIGTFLQPGVQGVGAAHVWLDTEDPTQFKFLQIVGGRLVSVTDQPFLPTIVLGQLYRNDGTTPQAQQPGGPGTPVTMPLETQGEMIGMWMAGCGHFFNVFSVYSAQIQGVTSALVCCPMCLYVQRIIQPYSAIHPVMAGGLNDIIFA
jgi:hypothetical protein